MIAIMPKTLIDELLQLPAIERSFGAGEHLFRRGDGVRAVYQILDGSVHLVRYQAEGGAIILQRAGAGSILAEASLFSESYHCDAVACVPTRTRSIKKSVMRARLAQSRDLTDAWAAYLAREVQNTRQRCEILSLKTVAARLDAWFASNEGRTPAKGEWKIVAAEIGTSPEALYRELARRRSKALTER